MNKLRDNWHPTQRGWFQEELFLQMQENKDIILLTGDLGYHVFDNHKKEFPDRVINCGAAEFSMMGIACGLALSGKIPFVYSITSFLIYRPFEILRTYVNHEKIPVRLIGSGRDMEYEADGISHWSQDVEQVLNTLPNIKQFYPQRKEDVPSLVKMAVSADYPLFISLTRNS